MINLMIVDDHKVIRLGLRLLLEKYGDIIAKMDDAKSGEQAVY